MSLDRIKQLVSDLEQALSSLPGDSPRMQALQAELDTLRQLLNEENDASEQLTQQLRGTHGALGDLLASVEGEILRDTPYLTEMARILGLV